MPKSLKLVVVGFAKHHKRLRENLPRGEVVDKIADATVVLVHRSCATEEGIRVIQKQNGSAKIIVFSVVRIETSELGTLEAIPGVHCVISSLGLNVEKVRQTIMSHL